jgi:hypothetical protein
MWRIDFLGPFFFEELYVSGVLFNFIPFFLIFSGIETSESAFLVLSLKSI